MSKLIGAHTNMVVGATIGAGLVYFLWSVFGLQYAIVAILYLLYEGWTLINSHPEDTLSESVWRFSARPLVPFIFGIAQGAWITYVCLKPMLGKVITPQDVLQLCAAVFLMGHFFFQAHKEGKKIAAAEAVEAAAEAGEVRLIKEPSK